MPDQLSLAISVTGGQQAVQTLKDLNEQARQAAASVTALGGSLSQATQQHADHTAAVNRSMGAYLTLGSAISGLPGPLGELGHAFGAIHTRLTDVQAVTLGLGAAIGGLGASIGGGLAGAVGEATHFAEQMGMLRATLPVADVEQFGGALTDLAQKLGRDTVFSSTQAIEAMGGLARAGLSTSDILGGVAKSTLDMAAAMGTDPKNAALALGAALREFNLTAADAPRVADLFSQAVHVAGLSADGLRTALGQAGPIIRAMGGDLQDAVTGIELLTRSGVSAGRAGTQLAQLYQDVVNPRTTAAAKVMKDLGFITEETGNKFVNEAGQVRPFVDVARILSEGLSKLTPQQEALATQTEFSRRAMLGAMIVANQYATGGLAALTEAQNNARTAAQAMQERLDNLWGASKQLSSSVQTLAVDIGGSLTPAIRPVVDGLKDLVDRFTELGPQAHTTIAAVAGVEAGVLTLAGAVTTLAVALPLVTGALAAAGVSLGAILVPVAAVAAASGLLAVAWVNDWGNIQETAQAAQTDIGNFWTEFKSQVDLATNYFLVKAKQIQDNWPKPPAGAGSGPGEFNDPFAVGTNALSDQPTPGNLDLTGLTAFFGRAGEQYGELAHQLGLHIHEELASAVDAPIEISPDAEAATEAAWRAAGAAQATAYIEKFQQSVQGLMMTFLDDAKGSYPKAIQEALAAGMQAVVAGLMTEQTEIKAIQDAIKNLSADRRAEVLEIQQQQGVQEALNHVYQSGLLDEQQYADALAGITESHKQVKTASEEHKAALQALVQSTDVAAVSQGLYAQHLDAFIEKTAASLPAIEGQARALINAGDSMGALRVEAQQLGLSQDTLIAASQGVVAAQNAVKAAVEGTTGSHEKAKTAAKTHAEAMRELIQSADASQVAIGLADQAYDKFASATLPHLTSATAAQVVALRNAGESQQAAALAASAYGFSLEDVNRITEGSVAVTARWNAALKGESIPTMNSYVQAIYDLNPNLDRAAAAGARFGLGLDQNEAIVRRAIAIQKEWQAALKEDEAAGRVTGGSMVALRNSFEQAAEEIAKAAAKASNAGQTFRQVGGYIQDGIRVGLGDFSSGELWQRVNGGLQALHDQAQDVLRAHSPSQLWAEDVGRPMAEGIGVGFTDAVPALVSAIQGHLQQVVDTASDYGRRAAGAFDSGLVFSGGSDQQSRPTGAFTQDAAQRYAQLYTRETGYPFPSFGIDPGAQAVEKQKQADAFMAEQRDYAERMYGTRDLAKANELYQAQNPQARYTNLLESAATSLLQSLMGKLPLASQAQYGAMAAGGNVMGTLQALWGAGGGDLQSLYNKLNNVEPTATYNPLLGPSANALLAPAGGSGGGSPGGNLTGTSGSGFATAPITFYTQQSGYLPSGSRQLDYGDMARNAADFSKALASLAADVPLVSLSWSSIKDWSKQADSSMAHVAGAFSAIPLDLNSKMLSSITGAWTLPTLGGPTGPLSTGPGSGAFTPSGNTAGGANFGALQTLIAQITAAHPDLSPDAQARAIQDGMRTNQDYLRVVGTLTDTTSDLERQQADARNEVFNWTNVVNQGIPAAQQLAEAQGRLTATMNQLAATVAATPPPVVTPPSTGLPGTEPGRVNLNTGLQQGPGGYVIINGQNYPAGTTLGPGGAVIPPGGFVNTGGTSSLTAPPPTPTTPTTTTTPTPTPTVPKPVGPVKIGTTATGLDVYQMPDGTLARVPAGSPPPGTTPEVQFATGGIVLTPTRALLGERGPEAVVPLGRMGLSGGGVTFNGGIHVTINGSGLSSPQVAAETGRKIREELRRQGVDVSRIGGL